MVEASQENSMNFQGIQELWTWASGEVTNAYMKLRQGQVHTWLCHLYVI